MDFSELRDAVASQSYTKIADICDSLMHRVPFYFSSVFPVLHNMHLGSFPTVGRENSFLRLASSWPK